VLPGGAPRTKKYGRPLMIGVTPGSASIARNASPKAPGIWRISRPRIESRGAVGSAFFTPLIRTSSIVLAGRGVSVVAASALGSFAIAGVV
jgi:hypothetical protein